MSSELPRRQCANAFLHAEASRVEVEIHYDERQLRLQIRDDGGWSVFHCHIRIPVNETASCAGRIVCAEEIQRPGEFEFTIAPKLCKSGGGAVFSVATSYPSIEAGGRLLARENCYTLGGCENPCINAPSRTGQITWGYASTAMKKGPPPFRESASDFTGNAVKSGILLAAVGARQCARRVAPI